MEETQEKITGRIGFIGLGIMGKPMAKNLLKAGYALVVHNRSQAAVRELVESGGESAASPREVAERCEVVITMLPNSPDVEAVVSGSDGVLAGAREGLIIVDMSSIAPATSQRLAALAERQGVAMLDAPVSGGEPKAIDGTLAIMVGGREPAFERVKPLLSILGASVVRIGEAGSGNIAKLANQMMVGLHLAAMSEAMVLARRAGVDPRRVFEAIRGGLAGSAVLDAKFPLVMKGDFRPGFRIELHLKDLDNALQTAQALGAPAALTSEVHKVMQRLTADGKGADDHGGLIQYFEGLAGVTCREPN